MSPRPGTPAHLIDPTEHANLAKFALDPAGESRLRTEVQRVASRFGLDPKKPVTWNQTRAAAEELGLHPSDIVRRPGRLSGAEMLAARNIVADNTRQLVRVSERLDAIATARPTATAEALAALDTEASALTETLRGLESQNDAMLGRFIRDRSQTGRDLNNLKILAHTSLDPVAWQMRARNLRGGLPLTTEQQGTILRLVEDAQQNDAARGELARYVSSLRRAPLAEKAITLWKAGLLTSPTTHLANQVGNASMAALEMGKDAPAAVFDRILGTLFAGGRRTKGGPSLGTMAASIQGAGRGLREAGQVMRGRGTRDALKKYDLTHEVVYEGIPVVSRLLNGYTQTVYRSLVAGDRIWRGAALMRSLREQAEVLARQGGPSVRVTMANPPDDLMLRAIADGEIATFTDQTRLATAAGKVRDAAGPLGHVVLPFTRTPANVATRMVEYGGGGLAAGVWKLIRHASDLTPQMQREISENMGRGSVGVLAIAAGYMMADKGLVRGIPANKPNQRDTDNLMGRPSYSVKIGDTWRDIRRISPLGNLIAYGATLHQIAQDPDQDSPGAAALGAAGRQVLDQSSLQGVTTALRSVEDPAGQGQRFAHNLAGSVVPTHVARMAQIADPTLRQTGSAADAIQSRIPFASRSLAPRVNQLGEDVTRERVEPRAVQSLLDFSNPRRDKSRDDAVRAEIAATGLTISDLSRKDGETPAAYASRARHTGLALQAELQRTIARDGYQRLTPEQRREVLEDVVSAVRRGQRFNYGPAILRARRAS